MEPDGSGSISAGVFVANESGVDSIQVAHFLIDKHTQETRHSFPRVPVPFILSNELFKPIRVPFLPVPAIPYHLIDSILRTPAKLTLSLRRVRVNDRNVAGAAVINDIRNLDAIHTFKGFYELQNALALPCSQVIRNQTTVVLDRLKSVHVASGEVHDVDVVPDAGAIRCVIVVPENMQLLQHSRCTLCNTRPIMFLAIYRNQSIGVVKK